MITDIVASLKIIETDYKNVLSHFVDSLLFRRQVLRLELAVATEITGWLITEFKKLCIRQVSRRDKGRYMLT